MTLPPQEPASASLEDISLGREVAQRETKPDAIDRLEVAKLDKEMYQAQIAALTSRTSMREGYEWKVYWYLVGYTVASFALLVASGLGWLDLPTSVLFAVAGSTAVSAIGLVAQIGKGLFGSSSS